MGFGTLSKTTVSKHGLLANDCFQILLPFYTTSQPFWNQGCTKALKLDTTWG